MNPEDSPSVEDCYDAWRAYDSHASTSALARDVLDSLGCGADVRAFLAGSNTETRAEFLRRLREL